MAAAMAGLGIMLALAGALIVISEPLYKSIAGRNRPISEEPIYNPGTYEGTARGYGGPVTVKIDVTEYEIKDVKISAPDETPEIGKAVAEKLSKEIWMEQAYTVDSVSGATMTSNAVKSALGECFRGAAKEGTMLADIIARETAKENGQGALPEVEELLKDIEDGIYKYKDETDDGSGYFNVIEMTVEDEKIRALKWDSVDASGTSKRELSKSGQYTMTDNGPLWYEQADMVAQYVLENQTTNGLLNESGTTDAVASVSIHIGGFADALKECLLTARGDVSRVSLETLLKEAADGDYSYVSDTPDDNGFCDSVQLTVKDHKLTSLKWDAVKADGSSKRQLSKEGHYTMTDDGPLWYEQADALSKYLIENQTEKGLSDGTGYASDAVASVSIYIGGFEDAVKKCLMQ